MTRILFVCHGNICRSPMAEFVMKDMVKKAGLEAQFDIASAATSAEEVGSPVYPPARRKLAEHGISCEGKRARQLTREDAARYDLLIGMDRANLRNMRRICGDVPDKLRLLLDFTDRQKGAPAKPLALLGRGEARERPEFSPQAETEEKGAPAKPKALLGRGEARERPEFSPQAETEESGLCFDEVADPWYTGDFEATWRDVEGGCRRLLETLTGRETDQTARGGDCHEAD